MKYLYNYTQIFIVLVFFLLTQKVYANGVLVTIAEAPGQQSSTVSGVSEFDFESLTTGRHSNVIWSGVGVIDELLVHEGYFGFGAYDSSDGLNSRFNWNGWPGWSGNDPVVSATTITLDQRSAYFGLYWSAGDGDDIIRFYDGETLVAEFSTQNIVQSAALTQEYFGDPNHQNQWNPSLPYNHTEPYAYINFYGDANTKWDRVVLTQTHDLGSGFETDNLSSRVAPVLSSTDDVSSTGDIIATVNGMTTTVETNETSTWSFEGSEESSLTYESALSAEIINTITETVGSNYEISGSGDASNTTNWVEGIVGKFTININGETKYLTVNASNVSGLDPSGDSLMVIQTVNSQGLTDTGTLSIYFRPTDNSFVADISFNFWEDEDATIPLNPNIQVTVLDLDHNQKFQISNDSFNSYYTYTDSSGNPTKVTVDVGSTTTEFEGVGNSVVNEPLNAVSLLTDSAQIEMSFSHTSVYLAMFEFRTPSVVLSEGATPDSDGDGLSDISEGIETGTVNIVDSTNEENSSQTEPGDASNSVKLTDHISTNGIGQINLLKNLSPLQLEAFRQDNNGMIVLGVDVSEAINGTENNNTQGITVKSLELNIELADGSIYSFSVFETETKATVAEVGSTDRYSYFTNLGDDGSNRTNSSNAIQDIFDSTIKINVNVDLSSVTTATLNIVLLETNENLGDPETFYDFSNGSEELAILNQADSLFIDELAPGRDEAPVVELTYSENSSDLDVSSTLFYPSANDYYSIGYEDLYPSKGDYDFNDLIVAYKYVFI